MADLAQGDHVDDEVRANSVVLTGGLATGADLAMRWEKAAELRTRNSLRVGGTAARLAEPEQRAELIDLVRSLRRDGTAFFMLGGGTNTLFDDGEYAGVVISTRRLDRLEFDPHDFRLTLEPGVPLTRAIRVAVKHGAVGLESFAGIPGCVGGAVYGNAGGCGKGIGEIVERIQVIELDGSVTWLARGRDEMRWQYRSSGLGDRVVVQVVLALERGEQQDVDGRAGDVLDRKRSSQPLSEPSAGCVFKNPAGDSAGRLIEAAGLKGLTVGGAQVSHQHANFIVTDGEAEARHVFELIEKVRAAVRGRFGFELELEIVTPGRQS